MPNRFFSRPCPDPTSLDRVRAHTAHGYPEDVLRAALEAARNRGTYIIERMRGHRGPAADRALIIIQAAVEELDGIAAALAAGEGTAAGGLTP
jgi:hypothetical protein